MGSTILLLATALALRSTDASASVFDHSAFRQRSLETSSVSATGSGDYPAGFDPDMLAVFSGYESNCTGIPFMAAIMKGCTPAVLDDSCASFRYDEDGFPMGNQTRLSQCATELDTNISQLFGSTSILRFDGFQDEECTNWLSTNVYMADGKCHAQFTTFLDGSEMSAITTINANGSASWVTFRSSDCSGDMVNNTLIDLESLGKCGNNRMVTTSLSASDKQEGSESKGSGNAGMLSVGGAASRHVVAGIAILAVVFAL